MQERDTVRYGRTVAEVILPDGRSLNYELVRTGYAWWYVKCAPADQELKRLEAEARAEKRGLWIQPNPTPPWEWRQPYVVETARWLASATAGFVTRQTVSASRG